MKSVRVPVASHGLHHHALNYPFLGTTNFMDLMPVHLMPLRKGERYSVKASMFSRLNAVVNPAFATGRYIFKAYFVPHRFVFRPWYNMLEGTEYVNNHGLSFLVNSAPYTYQKTITKYFIDHSSEDDPIRLCAPIVDQTLEDTADFWYENNGVSYPYTLTPYGARLFKILNCLGYSPTWFYEDTTRVNILPMLSWIRLYLDYYFPNQYVGNSDWDNLNQAIMFDNVDYTSETVMYPVLLALFYCSCLYYQNSIFDFVWDNPVGPNSGVLDPSIEINDPTVYSNNRSKVVNNALQSGNPTGEVNKTPIVKSTGGSTASTYAMNLSQYILDALQSLNNFVKRHQLAGGRLLDRALASRGQKLSNDVVNKSYYLGQKSFEISIDAVENNTSDQLGDLAGKGISSSNDDFIKFDVNPDDDGLFIISCEVVPDCDLPVYNDLWNQYVDQMEFYHSEFDKLGCEYVPAYCIHSSKYGHTNKRLVDGGPFGFLNRYAGQVQDRTRLVGDFRVFSRGAKSLESYHTFRLFLDKYITQSGLYHSYQFVQGFSDNDQYNRLFYSEKVDNLQLILRFWSDAYLEKLPLGDSYDWDDDEFNEKVSILLSNHQ